MRAPRRRLWTWSLTVVAMLVVVAATISALFSLAVDLVPGYRVQVETALRGASNQAVRIGALNLRWRGFQPVLVLEDLRLDMPADGAGLSAPELHRVEVSFDLWRLTRGEWIPDDVRIRGLKLKFRHAADGRWTVDGFEVHPQADVFAPLRVVQQIDRVRFEEVRIDCLDPAIGDKPIEITIERANLHNSGEHHQFDAALRPPAAYARALSLNVDAIGALDHPLDLDAQWSATVTGIAKVPGLKSVLADDTQLDLADAQLGLSGHFQQRTLLDSVGHLGVRQVSATRAGSLRAEAANLNLRIHWRPLAEGWQVSVAPDAEAAKRFVPEAAAEGASAPALTVSWTQAAGADAPTILATAPTFELGDFTPWIGLLRGLPPTMAALQGLRGTVSAASLRLTPGSGAKSAAKSAASDPDYALSASLNDLMLPGAANRPAISGVSGVLEADSHGGQFKLSSRHLGLEWPEQLPEPIAFSALDGVLSWRHAAEGWRIGAAPLSFALHGASGQGSLQLLLSADAAPVVDAHFKLNARDLVALKTLMPVGMGPHTREWLTRAVQGGRVSRGELVLQGPINQFPFNDPAVGHWGLDLDLADVDLAFSPTWPPLTHGTAKLKFVGSGLDIAVSEARIGQVDVDPTHAQVADLRDADLLLDGHLHGEGADFFAVLRNSPLHSRLSGLLNNTEVSGPAAVTLHLQVPLREAQPNVHADGTVQLDGVTLTSRGGAPPIADVHGLLTFGGSGVSAESLTGRIDEAHVDARIVPDAVSREGLIEARLAVATPVPNGLLSRFIPPSIRSQLEGVSHWTGRFPLSGPDGGHLTLSSDLQGLASRLPPPLRKVAAERLPLTVQISQALVRLEFGGGNPLNLAIRNELDAAGAGHVRGVEARFGGGPLPMADGEGVVAVGTPTLFDIPAWIAFAEASGSGERDALKLNRIDVNAQALALGSFRTPAAHVLVEPSANGYRVQLDGPGAQGQVELRRGDGGHVIGDFETLHVQRESDVGPAVTAGADDAPYEPAHWPTFELRCAHLMLGEADLGRLSLSSSRIEGGQKVDNLLIRDGVLDAEGQGEWRRLAGQSSAQLRLKLDGRQIGPILQGLGYADSLTGQHGRFEGQLNWADDPAGVVLADARGSVRVEVESGAIKAVEPGAGRILGLLNLYALPRRLLLNFSDVTNKGLGFDSLDGDFVLADGDATTDNLDIRAPSVKLEVRGRVGLAARDYDEHVTVNPQGMSTGVTVGAALLGGPAGAAIALIAQQLFDKPLDRLTQFSYHVTGSWDHPEVLHGDGIGEPVPPTTVPLLPPENAAGERIAPQVCTSGCLTRKAS